VAVFRDLSGRQGQFLRNVLLFVLFFSGQLIVKDAEGERGWNEGRTRSPGSKKEKERKRQGLYKNFSQLPKHSLIGGHYVDCSSPTPKRTETAQYSSIHPTRMVPLGTTMRTTPDMATDPTQNTGSIFPPSPGVNLPSNHSCKWQISRWPSPRSLA